MKTITQVLPPGLRARLEVKESGNDRDEREVAWYYRYLEMGHATEAALYAGYSDEKAQATASRLKKKFAGLILEGLQFVGQADLPVVKATLLRVMEAYDPEAKVEIEKTNRDGSVIRYMGADPNKASSSMASAAVKAAEAMADRFGLVKGLKIEIENKGSEEATKTLIDRIVASQGVEVVRMLPMVMEHREYREYFLEGIASGKYGKDVIDITPEVVESPAKAEEASETGYPASVEEMPGPEAAGPLESEEPDYI